MMVDQFVEHTAAELIELLGTGRQIGLLTDRNPRLDLPMAYAIAEEVRSRREAVGERVVGRKIGFTNYRMWEVYDVKAPMWGYLYDSSVVMGSEFGNTLCIQGMPEPKIEPEIIFGLGTAPAPGMDEAQLARCIDWMALGFEIVQSFFPGWRFRAADAVAAFGVHAALIIDRRMPMVPEVDWSQRLSTFGVTLQADGEVVASGGGSDVLGSPLTALRFLNDLLADPAFGPPIRAGEIISTGTLTLAASLSSDQTWLATAGQIDLPPISVQVSRTDGHRLRAGGRRP